MSFTPRGEGFAGPGAVLTPRSGARSPSPSFTLPSLGSKALSKPNLKAGANPRRKKRPKRLRPQSLTLGTTLAADAQTGKTIVIREVNWDEAFTDAQSPRDESAPESGAPSSTALNLPRIESGRRSERSRALEYSPMQSKRSLNSRDSAPLRRPSFMSDDATLASAVSIHSGSVADFFSPKGAPEHNPWNSPNPKADVNPSLNDDDTESEGSGGGDVFEIDDYSSEEEEEPEPQHRPKPEPKATRRA
mmetsp:Transcript_7743/g.22349  ORF Transcript_7743/g.22349 Transcript_7743/m.22349 type:complete len:247 (-) Transcript_7743:14-754(-)